jgi:hypothetical protein
MFNSQVVPRSGAALRIEHWALIIENFFTEREQYTNKVTRPL